MQRRREHAMQVLGLVLGGLMGALAQTAEPPEPPRPSSYVLQWSAPARCPDARAVTARIEALLGGAHGDDGEMQVEAAVTEHGGRFTLALTTSFLGETDVRPPVTAPRCEDLADTAALTVAIALDPGSARRHREGPEPPPATEPAEHTTIVPAPVSHRTANAGSRTGADAGPRTDGSTRADQETGTDAEPATTAGTKTSPQAPTHSKRPADVVLRVAVAGTYGDLPRVGGGNLAAVGLLWPRLRLEVFGIYQWPQRNVSNTGLFQMGGVGSRACVRLRAKAVEFPLCGGVEAGVLRAAGRNLQRPVRIDAPIVALLAGAGVAVRGKRIGFWSLAELGGSVLRPRFLVGNETAFRGSPVSFRLAAGIEFFFSVG